MTLTQRPLSDTVQTHVVSQRAALAEAFRTAVPFPHVVIDNFLADSLCLEVLEQFPAFETGNARNESGGIGGKSVVERVRGLGPAFTKLDDAIQTPGFLSLIGTICGMSGLLYDPDYIGGGTHENRANQDLDPHIDFNFHPRRGWHRRLNLIVYLNDEWDESWGGALELHTDPWRPDNRIKTVLPLKNRCVIFETSERSWHGFRRIAPPPDRAGLSRRSFAIYLYSKDRPAAETAPSHATVYVERPVPERVRAGASLSSADIDAIHTLATRRTHHIDRLVQRERQFVQSVIDRLQLEPAADGESPLTALQADTLRWLVARQDEHLRYLYEREKQFTDRLDDYDRRVRSCIPLGGPVVLASDVSGYWPDQWAGEQLEFAFETHQALTGLRIAGQIPAQMPRGQQLSLSIGSHRSARHLPSGPFEWSVPANLEARKRYEIQISATCLWTPSSTGGSSDGRELAWHVRTIDGLS
jgi:2OG-Fe(II) oxygenase superfamily